MMSKEQLASIVAAVMVLIIRQNALIENDKHVQKAHEVSLTAIKNILESLGALGKWTETAQNRIDVLEDIVEMQSEAIKQLVRRVNDLEEDVSRGFAKAA